jgi:hypothetical protein
MSYRTLAQLAHDEHFLTRVTACAATENIAGPERWSRENQWQLAAAPGFDDAYAYAKNTGVEDPGNNEGVINDSMILSAVQAIRGPVEVPQV